MRYSWSWLLVTKIVSSHKAKNTNLRLGAKCKTLEGESLTKYATVKYATKGFFRRVKYDRVELKKILTRKLYRCTIYEIRIWYNTGWETLKAWLGNSLLTHVSYFKFFVTNGDKWGAEIFILRQMVRAKHSWVINRLKWPENSSAHNKLALFSVHHHFQLSLVPQRWWKI